MALKVAEKRLVEIEQLVAQDAPRWFEPFVAGPEDLEDIEEFSEALFSGNPLKRKYIRHSLHEGHAVIFGLRRRDEIVASCILEMNVRQKRVYIVEYGVLHECRGKNLGLWLLKKVESIARRYGYKTITSHVTPDNAASLALHCKAGILPQRRVRRHFSDGQDAWYMRRQLAA